MISAKIFVVCLQSILIQHAFCQFLTSSANANSVIENAMGVGNGLGLVGSNFASASGLGMAGNLAGSNLNLAGLNKHLAGSNLANQGFDLIENMAESRLAGSNWVGSNLNFAGSNLNLAESNLANQGLRLIENLAGSNINLAGSNLASQGFGLIENLAGSNLAGSNLAGSIFANDFATRLFTPTTGVFTVTSYSPIVPYGLTVNSDNTIEGIVSVNGQLPFLSAVAFEASLPSTGQGVTTCGCGNGEIGITREVLPSPVGLGKPGFGNGLGLGRLY